MPRPIKKPTMPGDSRKLEEAFAGSVIEAAARAAVGDVVRTRDETWRAASLKRKLDLAGISAPSTVIEALMGGGSLPTSWSEDQESGDSLGHGLDDVK